MGVDDTKRLICSETDLCRYHELKFVRGYTHNHIQTPTKWTSDMVVS